MNLLDLIIISIVEGLTEFLPVSSTGHMMIAEGLLGVEMTTFVKSFTVIIQLGAILAVVVLYWRKFFYPSADALGKQTSAEGASVQASQGTSRFGQWWSRIWRFYLKLIVGVLPAVVVGLTLKDVIDQNLESVTMVAVMLIIGGVFMLFCDQLFAPKDKAAVEALSHTRDLSSRFHDWTLSVHCSGASWHFSLHGYHRGRHATKAHAQDGSGVLFLPRRSHYVWGCCEGSLRPHETWGRHHPRRWHGATPHRLTSAHSRWQPHDAPLGQPHRLCSGAYGSKILHSLHCTLWFPRFRMVSHHSGRSDFGFAPLRN